MDQALLSSLMGGFLNHKFRFPKLALPVDKAASSVALASSDKINALRRTLGLFGFVG